MTSFGFSLLNGESVRALGDDALLQRQRDLAGQRRLIDAESAVVAGEIARRSDRSLGMSGLAQKRGLTPPQLVSELTGMSSAEARSMVAVGDADAAPWLDAVVDGVTAGEVSVGAAAAIRSGLGEPGEGVDADALAGAARRLAQDAVGLAPEKVAIRARQARDELDTAGVKDREALLRSRRSLRLYPQPDGTTKFVGISDPENAALIQGVYDAITSPRRGGVRFVGEADRQRADDIVADPRTTEQLAFDMFMQLLRAGSALDDGTIVGSRAVAVRVHVRASDLQAGEKGLGVIEGQTAPVSIGTVHRLICEGGTVPILFDDDGRAMNVGRTRRLHTPRQRIAITARDGGCIAPGCDRPPSWSEIHHIDEFAEGGETSTDDGVCLCSRHHKWLHDTGRRIIRRGARYWLISPGERPVELFSKHPLRARRELARAS